MVERWVFFSYLDSVIRFEFAVHWLLVNVYRWLKNRRKY